MSIKQGFVVSQKVLLTLLVLNMALSCVVGGFGVYLFIKVRHMRAVADEYKEKTEASAEGYVVLRQKTGQSIAVAKASIATGFAALTASSYSDRLNKIISACDEIKAWVQAIQTTSGEIYTLLTTDTGFVGALTTKTSQIVGDIGNMQTSMENAFSSTSTSRSIITSITNKASSADSTVNTMTSNLNTLNTGILTPGDEAIANTQYLKSYLAGASFFSSPASIACAVKKKTILIVSASATNIVISTIIATTGMNAQVDRVIFTSDWVYSLPYYDLLIFDIFPNYYNTYSFSSTIQICVLAFLQRGGSVLMTIDIIDAATAWNSAVYTYFGVSYNSPKNSATATSVSVSSANACHQIFRKPNDLTALTSISVKTVTSAYSTGVAANLLLSYNGGSNPYLTAAETVVSTSYTTRAAYLTAGSTGSFTGDETKLIHNVIYWLLKY